MQRIILVCVPIYVPIPDVELISFIFTMVKFQTYLNVGNKNGRQQTMNDLIFTGIKQTTITTTHINKLIGIKNFTIINQIFSS